MSEPTDAAKLRDALELCMDEMCSRCRDLAAARSNPLPCLQGCEPVRKAKAALAAPPRNCDRFATVKEATEAFARERQDMPHPCPDFTFSRWLLTPVKKEGGAK